jgi:L-alanine-DL-glutamate epimerase-like enolase superfamily enzyme
MTRIVEVREQTVRLHAPIRNSLVDFSQMTVSVVAVVSDRVIAGRPVVGLGFNSIGRYAQPGMLRDRFIPRLLDASAEELGGADGEIDPGRVRDLVMRNEKPGGHGERSGAVAALEIAVWDLAAKLAEVPLYRLLADRFNGGQFDTRVDVYAAGGYYYPEGGIPRLLDEMRGYLDQGYTHLKMKIGGAGIDEDLERLEAVLALVPDGGHLAVDANGRFDLETAIAYAERMEPYGLRWYEQAGDPRDYARQSQL